MQHQYDQEQRQYWAQLRQEFRRYKAELGATNLELAQCLGISRQPLVSFMQGDRDDLPVSRAHLKQLWHQLSDPDWMQDKKLSADERKRRETFRRMGPNALLIAAGFLPENSTQSIDVEPERYQHLHRIVTSLSNVPDFTDFIRLADAVETELINRFFGFRDLSKPSKSEGISLTWTMSSKQIRRWIKHWIKHNLSKQPDAQVAHKFERAITKLVTSGKYDLDDAEIFELYISILENDRFERESSQQFKLKITQCQFTTLTFSLLDSAFNCSKTVQQQLYQAGFDTERTLRSLTQEAEHIENIVSDGVLEASVTCRLKDHEEICWRYSSSATHFENMLAAIARGMGYENQLELVDLSIHSLGSSDSSLIKVATTFRDSDRVGNPNIYQSVWVDRSAITGTAKSVSFAVRNWLVENLPGADAIQQYCDLCQTLATLDQDLSLARKALSDYVIRRPEQSINEPCRDFITQKVIQKIEQLRKTSLKHYPILSDWYSGLLDHRYCIAHLWCAHSASVEGNLTTASQFLARAEGLLDQPSLQSCVPLHILIQTEKMLHQFYGGNPTFFSQKTWRSQPTHALRQLQDYIYQDLDGTQFRKYSDRLEFDIYLCASDLFGRIGRLDFSLSDWGDSEYLDQAIVNLLRAAYCAAKIGNKQRAAHWIVTISRAYCRLGHNEQATAFHQIAKSMVEGAINPRYSSEYKESILAEVNLAHGERSLLIEANPELALKHFLMALKGATYIGFSRVISESLYGMARAARGLTSHRIETTFKDALHKNSDNPLRQWESHTHPHTLAPNPIATDTIHFINTLDKRLDWDAVSHQLQAQAKAIWHNWAIALSGEGAIHPLEAEIDSYRFLNRVQ